MHKFRASFFVTALLGIVIVVVTTRTFLNYKPPVPNRAESFDDANDETRATARVPVSIEKAPATLTESRIKRLQSIIRKQRSELAQLRNQIRPPAPGTVQPPMPTRKKNLLSRLANLSLLNPQAEDSELTPEELAARLKELGTLAMTLEEQLQAADSVVELQSSEIEDLVSELQDTRERVAAFADAGEDLDSVVEELLDESKQLEAFAREALTRLGAPAAATLFSMEGDQPPHVRAWAREVLLQITRDQDDPDTP